MPWGLNLFRRRGEQPQLSEPTSATGIIGPPDLPTGGVIDPVDAPAIDGVIGPPDVPGTHGVTIIGEDGIIGPPDMPRATATGVTDPATGTPSQFTTDATAPAVDIAAPTETGDGTRAAGIIGEEGIIGEDGIIGPPDLPTGDGAAGIVVQGGLSDAGKYTGPTLDVGSPSGSNDAIVVQGGLETIDGGVAPTDMPVSLAGATNLEATEASAAGALRTTETAPIAESPDTNEDGTAVESPRDAASTPDPWGSDASKDVATSLGVDGTQDFEGGITATESATMTEPPDDDGPSTLLDADGTLGPAEAPAFDATDLGLDGELGDSLEP